ncbi:YhdP family protein [Vibrio nereis]|uniref:YhdP central domain-containing protein n=1 Tax=Vibrio nereis TaxID=693 RepID=A0A0M0HLX6_VIBNE|nr:YhdP family protein [Vibrio nereis]KOO02783.1 hypothetical protein AKJ17_13680 [Vibrio nereis]
MSSTTTRITRWVLGLAVTVLVLLAIVVTALRITLPQLNHFQDDIKSWVSSSTGFELEIGDIRGFWRNSHPSILLHDIEVHTPQSSDISFNAAKIELELDMLQSLLQLQPVVADLSVYRLDLDITSVTLTKNDADQPVLKPKGSQQGVMQRLDDLLLRQLDDFSLLDSTIHFQGLDGKPRQLDIVKLRWKNDDNHHIADGEVSLADSGVNSAQVKADFVDFGSIKEVTGEFYLSAQNVRITPWLTKYLKTETGIEKGRLSFNSWFTLDRSQPVSAYLALEPTEVIWQEGQRHELLIESGIFELEPSQQGWQVNAHSLELRTDDTPWPELDMVFNWQPTHWRLNASQLDIEAISPLVKLAPSSKTTTDLLQKLAVGGRIEDIRVSMGKERESLRYSAELTNGRMSQWELLPELHQLSAKVSGQWDQASAQLSLIDDTLPYGDVFQAPLKIKQGQVDIVWQQDESGWRLWADKVTAATPDLQVLGAFRLDFPKQQSPFLSFYAEADLFNAGETWRYLPTLALGRSLTDYLSTAIQGGKVDKAKLVWFGELGAFPYKQNDGVFQASVGLKKAKFSFDTAWPPITDLQLDLLFENDAMYLDSRSATLQEVKATRITGRIPELAEGGHIEIEARAKAKGNAVRDYMTATPLVDSVGAALTAVQVEGDITSKFQLRVPFNADKEVRAWGYADLKKNDVNIKTPEMTLESVKGRIQFDNDVVKASNLKAQLLDQPVKIGFSGENASKGYSVGIDVAGNWKIKPIAPYLGEHWVAPLEGRAPWKMDVDLQLNDVGFTYQIDTKADLAALQSHYPYPLNKPLKQAGQARLQASGNQESISARVQLPNLKYQTEIDIRPAVPVLRATNLVVGKGSFKVSPVVGHHAQIRTDKVNLDRWLEMLPVANVNSSSRKSQSAFPEIPLPQRVSLNTKELTLAGIEWNDVDFSAKKKSSRWNMSVASQEVQGKATYLAPYDLSVALSRLHVFIPGLDEDYQEKTLFELDSQKQSLISEFDRTFHKQIPNTVLMIDDFWLQGYKVGKVNLDLQRKGDTIEWKKLSFVSGSNQVEMSGSWHLSQESSHTQLNVAMSGENNSDVMERFGISSGIQQAPFDLNAQLQWDGAPWSMKVRSLQGSVDTKLGNGVISDVSGAARLLGLFSLDSIIRKMQLDFTGVFDDGMAFDSITGSGEIKDGVFVTNDIYMDAVSGEMSIRGLANLDSRTVDAEVNFVPDITSGIPVFTAFAVTPQTALYVLAITTVISPVVEVFTQVNYEVKGPLDSPEVKELSRSKGEFKLPRSLKESAK